MLQVWKRPPSPFQPIKQKLHRQTDRLTDIQTDKHKHTPLEQTSILKKKKNKYADREPKRDGEVEPRI